MILGTLRELNIGEKYVGVVSDANGDDKPCTFIVLKKATYNDYLKQCIELNAIKPDDSTKNALYYKVAVD